MKLSIVTINYNDAQGLQKTLDSVARQTVLSLPSSLSSSFQLEHIIIDGASTDGSVDVIRDYEKLLMSIGDSLANIGVSLKWVSEKDNGVYNAMNKGIRFATGDYIQILNAGDIFASNDVLCKMGDVLCGMKTKPELIYGNMIRQRADGTIEGKSRQVPYSLLNYFTSTMNHDCCWIKRSLFINDGDSDSESISYGLYDEDLKIVSDWKWFLQAIGLGHVKPVYVDIDMTIFDTTGISERNLALRNEERRKVLEEVLPPAILADYDRYAFPMHQIDRLKKYHLYGVVYFIERVLFKLEKWGILK